MRLYRGKHGKEWVYGFLYSEKYILCDDTQYSVDPESVGQDTGLVDLNEKPLFESDIVKLESRGTAICVYRPGIYLFKILAGKWSGLLRINFDTKFKIIGNVTDNPELL